MPEEKKIPEPSEIVKGLELNQLLRYVFAGMVFFGVAASLYGAAWDFLETKSSAWLTAGLVLLAGNLIFAIHRAILLVPFDHALIRCFYPGKKKVDIDIDRFERRREPKSLQNQLSEWASQVHFMYCVAWAILAAWALHFLDGAVCDLKPSPRIQPWYALVPFGVMLGLAILNHVRYFKRECRISQIEPSERTR